MSENKWSALIAKGSVQKILTLIKARAWNGRRSLVINKDRLEIVEANKNLLTQLVIDKSHFEEYSYELEEETIHVEVDLSQVVKILMCTSGEENVSLTITPPETEIVIVATNTETPSIKMSMSVPFKSLTYKYDLPDHDYEGYFKVQNIKSFLKRMSLFNGKIDLACKKGKMVAYCSQGVNSLCIAELGEAINDLEVSSRRYDISLLQSAVFSPEELVNPSEKIELPELAPAVIRISNTLPMTVEFGHIKALIAADGSSPGAAVPKSFASYRKKSKKMASPSIEQVLMSKSYSMKKSM
eukprot:TRINITY_DN6795_c3_g1_i1.p1 TRINITY_DN6795_c3_g1~~TRINITY_DN6795_c3_g1_i1.p1  ORF type:complete len:298 (+),score=50.77 TRINITY_DN6795_c3_g1_i1:35-928(+)